MGDVQDWLLRLQRISGTGLHLCAGRAPLLRAAGELAVLPGGSVLVDAELRALLRELAGERRWQRFQREHDLDFAITIEGGARFLVHCFEHLRGVGAVIRSTPERVRTLDDLAAPETLQRLDALESGLFLVAGPPGSGKSTTLAAFVERINHTQSRHVVSLARSSELVQANARSIVSHREIGSDSDDMASGLAGALRQDADVVVVDEIEDAETAALALAGAARGRLVLGAMRAHDAVDAIERFVGLAPPDGRARMRADFAGVLAAIVGQQLVPTRDGGRAAVHEILVRSPVLDGVLREGRAALLASVVDTYRGLGMQTLDDGLRALVEAGRVDVAEAIPRAEDKKAFRRLARALATPG